MRRLRWQLLIIVIALIAIAFLLLGQQPVTETIVAQPVSGGIYTEGLVGSVQRLNPLLDFYNTIDRDIDRLLFSSLVRFDSNGLPQPDLADSWGIDIDAKVYNVSLRPNALWHDGTPVTTDDVIFTIELLLKLEIPVPGDYQALWSQVEIVRFDERTMQFRLPQPFAPFLDYWTFGILPKHILEGTSAEELSTSEFNLSPIGSGPYVFSQFIGSENAITGVALIANDNYYFSRPFIDQIIFRFYETDSDALTAYQNGEIEGIGNITSSIMEDALREEDLGIYSSRLPQLSIILLNLDNSEVPFFQDVEIRRALLAGINRQQIINEFLYGQGIIADGPILFGTWAFYDELPRVLFSRENAIQGLRSAGYIIPPEGGETREKDGIPLAFELVHPDTEVHTAIAKAIQDDLGKLGVTVTTLAVPYPILVDSYLQDHNYEAALVDYNLDRSPDPDPYPFWHQAEITGGQNYSGWDDRRASEYLEQARVSIDLEERTRLYQNFQIHFSRELPALPLYNPIYNYGVGEQVQGIRIGPIFEPGDRFFAVSSWYLLAESIVEDVFAPTLVP